MSLGWVAYGLYLPKLLMHYGFAEGLARNLITLELAIGVGLEPLIGALSEQKRRWLGTNLPLWALGVMGASGLLWVIPVLVALGPTEPTIGWIVAGMMVAWSIAMGVIRAPLFSQLGQYAVPAQLPQAASVIALLGIVPALMGDRLSRALVAMGPGVAFGVSSLVLVVSGLIVQRVVTRASLTTALQKTPDPPDPIAPAAQPRWIASGALMFGLGLTIAFGSALLRSRFGTFKGAAGGIAPSQLLTWAQAIALLPAGWLAVRTGNRRLMGLAVGGLAIALMVTGGMAPGMAPGLALGLAVICGLCLSAVQTGSIPLALACFPQTDGGLAIGLFFGGSNLAGLLVRQLGTPVAASWAIGGGVTAFVLAGLGLWFFSPSRRPAHPGTKVS